MRYFGSDIPHTELLNCYKMFEFVYVSISLSNVGANAMELHVRPVLIHTYRYRTE